MKSHYYAIGICSKKHLIIQKYTYFCSRLFLKLDISGEEGVITQLIPFKCKAIKFGFFEPQKFKSGVHDPRTSYETLYAQTISV